MDQPVKPPYRAGYTNSRRFFDSLEEAVSYAAEFQHGAPVDRLAGKLYRTMSDSEIARTLTRSTSK